MRIGSIDVGESGASTSIGTSGSLGSDVFLFVSGTSGVTGSLAKKTVFGGDVVFSGSYLTIGRGPTLDGNHLYVWNFSELTGTSTANLGASGSSPLTAVGACDLGWCTVSSHGSRNARIWGDADSDNFTGSVNVSTGDVTIEWYGIIYGQPGASYGRLINVDAGVANSYLGITIRNDNTLYGEVDVGGTFVDAGYLAAGIDWRYGDVVHLAVVWRRSASAIDFWVNGNMKYTATNGSNALPALTGIGMGSWGLPTSAYVVRCDPSWVSISNVARSGAYFRTTMKALRAM